MFSVCLGAKPGFCSKNFLFLADFSKQKRSFLVLISIEARVDNQVSFNRLLKNFDQLNGTIMSTRECLMDVFLISVYWTQRVIWKALSCVKEKHFE